MIWNELDLGAGHPFLGPTVGSGMGSARVEGDAEIPVGRYSAQTTHSVKCFVKAWQSIGGQPALSISATRYALRQAQEMARNRNVGPVYIRWTATADPGASLNTFDLADGWYWITRFQPDYSKVSAGLVPCQLQVIEVVQGGTERRQGMNYSPLSPGLVTTATGTPLLSLAFPINATTVNTQIRGGGEGNVVISTSIPTGENPLPFYPSATIADWFKGAVKVYDTINTTSNPVPSAGGTFVHANWVQVFDRSHRFEGDIVVTNGLHLYLFQVGTAQALTGYVWSNGNWGNSAGANFTLVTRDNAATACTLRGASLGRVDPEECAVSCQLSTGTGWQSLNIRLQRGQTFGRVEFRPITQAPNDSNQLILHGLGVSGTPKITYSASVAVTDNAVGGTAGLAAPTDYLYSAMFPSTSVFPMVMGWLYQSTPTNAGYNNQNADLGYGDTGQAINTVRLYGFHASPYNVNGAPLQQEAEVSTTLAGAWVAVTDAGASGTGNNAVKLPTGTSNDSVSNVSLTTAFTPLSGTYILAVRLRISAVNASTTAFWRFAIYDTTTATYYNDGANCILDVAPNVIPTTWGQAGSWFRSRVFSLTNGHAIKYYAQDIGAAGATPVDLFLDEFALLPLTLPGATGPQDAWQQFIADRRQRIVRI